MQDSEQNLQASSDSPSPSTPGAIFAAHRLQAGLSIADISAKLKLSKRQIEALESDDYAALPGNTFVRGFVRNYARLLGLDAQPLVHYLDSHLPKETSQAVLPRLRDEALPVLRPDGSSAGMPFALAVLAGMLLFLLLGGGAYWLFINNGHFEPELTLSQPAVPVAPVNTLPQAVPAEPVVSASDNVAAPVTEVTDANAVPTPAPAELAVTPDKPVVASSQPATATPPGQPAGASGASAVPTPVPVSAAKPSTASATVAPAAVIAAAKPANEPTAGGGGELRVVAQQDSWVQITDAEGKRLVNELLPAGAVRSVGGKAPYKVRIGNGRHTELYYKGKATDLTPYIKVDVANLELN